MTAVDAHLNTEQKAAVEHDGGPLLIIAGAGTGKTTVVTERIRYLIKEKGVKPSEILALTFTEKASREMEERVDIALPYGYSQLWTSTFHSFGDRILRNEAIHIGLNPGYKLMSEAEATIFFRKHLFEFDLKYFRPLGNPTKFIGAMLTHFSRLRDEDIAPSEYIEWAEKENGKWKIENGEKGSDEGEKYLELSKAYQKYEELKTKEGMADFSDLISNTIELFRKRPNVLKQYRDQFKYILVDEFQDTNYAQYSMIQLLAPPDQNPELMVVGDDNQSIYRFRGAAVSNILMFMEHYKTAKTVVLTKNYRSTQEILDRSYQLIKFNDPDTLEAKLGINKRLISSKTKKGSTIETLFCDRVEDEAEEVAQSINDLKLKTDNVYQWKDFAVLVRANGHAEPFTRAFSRAGIPYQFLGPGQLFQQKEIKDLISYLKLLADIGDSISLYRVLAMDEFELSPRDLAALSSFSKRFNLSFYDVCEIIASLSYEKIIREDNQQFKPSIPYLNQKTKETLVTLITMIHRHMELLPTHTAGQILFYFLEDTGILQTLTNYKTAQEERIALNLAKFFDKLKTYEGEHEDSSVPAVVDWIDTRMELGESPAASNSDWAENDAVTIRTNHSAKGLEFPVVYMVNLVEGRFPTRERKEAIPIPEKLIKEILPTGDYHMEEERRLFYVGMTRAKDKLFFSSSNFYGEGKRERKSSPFISEAVGPDALGKKKQKGLDSNQLFLFDWRSTTPEVPIKTTEELLAPLRHPITYLSYSQIETFRFCPLHYKARYILRLPTPIYAAQSFGQTIHLTMRRFYTGLMMGEKWGLDKLLEIYNEAWIPLGFSGKSHEAAMKQEGVHQLTQFFDTFHQNEPLPKMVEQPFVFNIAPQLKVGGVIDRVNVHGNGKIEIIDYKTAAKVPTQKEVDKNQQLTIYALAATEVKDPNFTDNPEDVLLTLYFLGTGEKRTTVRTREQLEQAKKEVIEVAKEIETSDFACSGTQWCKTCEYKMLCSVTS